MPRGMLFAFALLLPLCFASVSSATSDAGRFDGTWDVTLVCPKASDGALPFTFEFTADVKGAMLHGVRGLAGQPGWLSLDGPIQPDGAANLLAHGLTGNPKYQHRPDQANHSLRTYRDGAPRCLARHRQLGYPPPPHLRLYL